MIDLACEASLPQLAIPAPPALTRADIREFIARA
jgi:hypothetical protein